MQGEGESKKQTRLAWMEKLLIGMSLLLLVGFGAVLFGVPFLNDAVIRTAQRSVAKALGVGPDPKLLDSGSSHHFGKGGTSSQFGEKCSTKRIAVTLDIDTPLNRSVAELLTTKLKDSGSYDVVKFFDSDETAIEDFDRWVTVIVDDGSLPSSITKSKATNGAPQTNIEVKYSVVSEPFRQTLSHKEFPLADPLVEASDSFDIKHSYKYPGSISQQDLIPMLPDKIAENVSRYLLSTKERCLSFGEIPTDLPRELWPAAAPDQEPAVLNDFAHHKIRSCAGFLTESDELWLVEVPSMELRDFYRRMQTELVSKEFNELEQHGQRVKFDMEEFRIPSSCAANSRSPEHNDYWEIYPAPRPELIGLDRHLQEKAAPAATTLLYLHYVRAMPTDKYRDIVQNYYNDPEVSLEKVLMFRHVLANNKAAFEALLRRFDSEENDLTLSMVRFENSYQSMSDEDRLQRWKQLFIRQLKENSPERYDSVLSRTLGRAKRGEIFRDFATELKEAGVPELVETSTNNIQLLPEEIYSAFLTDASGELAIAKTYILRKSSGEIQIRQEIQIDTSISTTSQEVSTDGSSQSINAGFDDFRVEAKARILDPATGEVEVELKKGKP